MKKIYLLIIASLIFTYVDGQNVFYEGFEDLDSLYNFGGWVQFNNSNPPGAEIWHNGAGVGLGLDAFDGSQFSFAEVSFQSVAAGNAGTISNWLMTPTINLSNGMIISFYTSAFNTLSFPDRLELRINKLNTYNVGSSDTSVGDFVDALLTINPLLLPDTTLYPQGHWGQFSTTVSGLSGATNCTIALRYFVTDGGDVGANSSTIGVDAFNVDIPTAIVKPEVKEFELILYPNPVTERLTLDFLNPLKENMNVDIYDALGKKVISFVAQRGQLKASFSTNNLSAGAYTVVLKSNGSITKKEFIKN